eukprot:scaffold281488_cov23-Tisochrysis_lutea.AAC.1
MVRSIKRGHPAGADLRVWARRMAAKAQCPGESGSVRAYEMRECDLERSEPCWDVAGYECVRNASVPQPRLH